MRRILLITALVFLFLVVLGGAGTMTSHPARAQDQETATPTLTPTVDQATDEATAQATDQAEPLTAAESLQLTLQAAMPLPTLDLSTLPPGAIITSEENGAAPDFSIETFAGQTFKLSDYRGKVVLINFWASWCGPCHAEMPDLLKTWATYKDRVVFIGLAVDDDLATAHGFVNTFNIPYPIAFDSNDAVATAYSASVLPTTVIIDKQGQIRTRLKGGIDINAMPLFLDRLIGQ